MNRLKIDSAVHMSEFAVEKFKRCKISLYFTWPSNKKTATAEALLPFLMERSYAACPDMSELSKRLAALYGASLSVEIMNVGANRILCVSVIGIKDEYSLNGENLSMEYAEMALNVAFRPYLVDGVFNEENVEIEKEQLFEQLQSEINDKRSYCIRQARRKFYKNAPQGIERNGYIEEVKALSAKDVTDAWENIIKTAHIDVMVLGANFQIVQNQVKAFLSQIERAPTQIAKANAMEKVQVEEFEEIIDTNQSKLCMIFTMQKPATKRDFVVLRVATAILGGTATSRLFKNVREKMSLCYYCAAYSEARNGMLTIDSGIEHTSAQKAKDAILNEITLLINEEIEQKELDEIKKSICERLKSVQDSPNAIESWYFSEILRDESIRTPQDMMNEIQSVSAHEIKEMLKQFSLSVVYLITKGENS